MSKSSKKYKYSYLALKVFAVLLFMGGFVYQTLQFLFLYWTYPTVVDIQQSSPSYLEMPAFTICNRIGYLFDNFCTAFGVNPCSSKYYTKFIEDTICAQFPYSCMNGTVLANDYKVIFFRKFMEEYAFKRIDIPLLAQPLEDYLNCTIEFAGRSTKCNLENVLGSMYTTDDLPQFCYTIYSKWGKPEKERELIPRGSTMKLSFSLNITRKPIDHPDNALYEDGHAAPNYSPPGDPAVQIAVHSPYFLPSPYFDGFSFIGGHSYEMRIKLSESHLLPLPYQTNCTDYMKAWHERGGKAPINQLNVIQECRANVSYEQLGCVPVTLDYPHEHDLCKSCPPEQKQIIPCDWAEPTNDCTLLADDFNQPCDSWNYEVTKESKVITIFTKSDSPWADESDGIRLSIAEYDCEGGKVFRPECSVIDIDIPFDRFEITNITYNAKFESLEVFSVVGGYMGMWLGISLLTVFDLFSDIVVWIRKIVINRKNSRVLVKRNNFKHQQNYKDRRPIVEHTTYNVW